jgi:hypothetical protein
LATLGVVVGVLPLLYAGKLQHLPCPIRGGTATDSSVARATQRQFADWLLLAVREDFAEQPPEPGCLSRGKRDVASGNVLRQSGRVIFRLRCKQ